MNASYEWGGKEYKLNHLLFMDDLKFFGKSEHQIDSLASTCHTLSTDIGMKFGLKNCGILNLKRGKVTRCEGIKLPDGEVLTEVEQEGYRYLEIIELDKIKESEMKERLGRQKKAQVDS